MVPCEKGEFSTTCVTMTYWCLLFVAVVVRIVGMYLVRRWIEKGGRLEHGENCLCISSFLPSELLLCCLCVLVCR